MIRRPLNERFAQKVLDGIKTTTIRDNPWPVGVPIMLFRWEGKPYRSKQINIAPVVVEETCGIGLWVNATSFTYASEQMIYNGPLWQCEGFDSRDDMDAWFLTKMRPGPMVAKALMRFRLWTCGDSDRYFDLHGKMP